MLDPARIPRSCLPDTAPAFDAAALPAVGASPDGMLRLGTAAPGAPWPEEPEDPDAEVPAGCDGGEGWDEWMPVCRSAHCSI